MTFFATDPTRFNQLRNAALRLFAETDWRRIRKIADGLEVKAQEAFLAIIEDLLKRYTVSEIASAFGVSVGAVVRLFDDLERDLQPLADVVRVAYNEGGQEGATHLFKRLGLEASFDLLNPNSVTWLAVNEVRLTGQIAQESRDAIRVITIRAFTEGLPPREAARLIRQHIGLTERSVTAVARYEAALIKQGVAPERVAKLVEAYQRKLLNGRALNIARTEIINAANGGQLASWQQARAQGLLDGTEKKRWIVTPDDRLCAFCKPMRGQQVGIDEDFVQPDTGVKVKTPGLHNGCRCAMGLVFAED